MITALPTTTTSNTSVLAEKRELVWNTPRTVESIIEEVEQIQSRCADYTAKPLSESFFKVENNTAILEYQDIDGMVHSSPLSVHSLSQLCIMAGVPVGYMRKCIESDSDWGISLAEDNLNTWLGHSSIKDTFMREYDGSLRGVLSSRFTCFDAPEIAHILNDNLNEEFDVVGSMINEERFHARIINKYAIDTKADKNLCWGFYVDSSDVGRSSVSITLFIWRQACRNGLVVPLSKGVTFSHVHRGFECEFANGILNTINNAQPMIDKMTALIDKANDISVKEALSGNSYAREKLEKTIKAHTALSDRGLSDIFYYLDNGIYDATLWGVVNAMTEVAQKYNLERRIGIEKAAGKLLMTA